MNFFLKLVGLPQNRSESFGIDPNSVPAKFGGPSTPRTPTRDLVPFPYLMLIPEYPILIRSFQSVKGAAECWR